MGYPNLFFDGSLRFHKSHGHRGRTFGVMKKYFALLALVVLGSIHPSFAAAPAESPLEESWRNPPPNARLRAYWWWLNGNVTKEAITRDLEEMKAKGFGGAVIVDAGGAEQDG